MRIARLCFIVALLGAACTSGPEATIASADSSDGTANNESQPTALATTEAPSEAVGDFRGPLVYWNLRWWSLDATTRETTRLFEGRSDPLEPGSIDHRGGLERNHNAAFSVVGEVVSTSTDPEDFGQIRNAKLVRVELESGEQTELADLGEEFFLLGVGERDSRVVFATPNHVGVRTYENFTSGPIDTLRIFDATTGALHGTIDGIDSGRCTFGRSDFHQMADGRVAIAGGLCVALLDPATLELTNSRIRTGEPIELGDVIGDRALADFIHTPDGSNPSESTLTEAARTYVDQFIEAIPDADGNLWAIELASIGLRDGPMADIEGVVAFALRLDFDTGQARVWPLGHFDWTDCFGPEGEEYCLRNDSFESHWMNDLLVTATQCCNERGSLLIFDPPTGESEMFWPSTEAKTGYISVTDRSPNTNWVKVVTDDPDKTWIAEFDPAAKTLDPVIDETAFVQAG